MFLPTSTSAWGTQGPAPGGLDLPGEALSAVGQDKSHVRLHRLYRGVGKDD